MCALFGVAPIASLFVKEYDLNQEHVTEQGFVNGANKVGQNRMSLTQKWRRLRLLPTFDLKLYWEMAEKNTWQ